MLNMFGPGSGMGAAVHRCHGPRKRMRAEASAAAVRGHKQAIAQVDGLSNFARQVSGRSEGAADRIDRQ